MLAVGRVKGIIMKEIFLVCYFGRKFRGMLVTLIHSINRSCPNKEIHILYYDAPAEMTNLSSTFCNINLVPITPINADATQAAAFKPLIISNYLRSLPEKCKVFVIDVDMVVKKDPFDLINGNSDIVFTTRDGVWPINGGILGISDPNRKSVCDFFEAWARQIMLIVSDKEAVKIARSPSHPYGHVDQMTFYQLINYSRKKSEFSYTSENKETLIFRAESGELLNETRSCVPRSDVRVVHYKGGWHSILLDGTGFTKNRPRSESWFLFCDYWKNHNDAIIRFSDEKSRGSWRIRPPIWYNPGNGNFSRVKYQYQCCLQKITTFWQRIRQTQKKIRKYLEKVLP